MSGTLQRHSVRRKTAGETLERWLTTLYARYKRRYLHVVLAFVSLVTVFLVIPISAFLCFAVAVPLRAIPPLMGVVFVAGAVTAPPIIFSIVLGRHRVVTRWLAGSDADPADAWRSMVVDMPRTILLTDVICGLCAAVPGFWAATAFFAFSPSAAVLAALAIGITFMGSLAFWLLVIEIVWRPLATDVGSQLPPNFRSTDSGRSMRRRLFAITLMLVLFTGIAVGDLSALPRSYTQRLFLVVGATIVVALTVSGLLAALLRHSILSRVEELRDALNAVRRGSRDVRLRPIAGDEIDEVGESFNEMVEQLGANERSVRDSRARLVLVADGERRRMERDLHDGAQQYLALMGLQASGIAERVVADPALASDVEELRSTLTNAQTELRNLAHGIYPATLETEGVASALREAAGRATVPVAVDSDGVGRLPRELEAAIYFVCLEALQNVSKYAGPDATATIELARADHRVEFTVSDNGVGFDVDTKGHGLVNMQDRIGALGGDVTITSAPGRGTTVSGWVPLDGTTDGN